MNLSSVRPVATRSRLTQRDASEPLLSRSQEQYYQKQIDWLKVQNRELIKMNKLQAASHLKLQRAHLTATRLAARLQKEMSALSLKLQRMAENYKVSKQILQSSIDVKLDYEWIIQKAMKLP